MNDAFRIHRRDLLGGLGAAAALSAFGYGPRAAMAQTASLRAAITGYGVVNTLDPAKASLIPEFYVIWSLFNGLLKFDDTMKIVPDLAESYRILEGGSIEFKLRAGVTFHDGSPLTADDVKFSLERLLDPATASPNASKVAAVDHVEVIDDLTVVVRTKTPFAPLLTFLTNARTGTQILPRKAFEAMGAEAFARKPVGTGPYKLASWDVGSGLKIEANEAYFGGAPTIKTVEIPLIAEEASGVTALLGNQIDLTSTVPTADVPQLMRNSAVTVFRQPGFNVRYISINLTKPPFNDVHFRRAVSMAFQREAMVQTVLFGEGEPLRGFFPPLLGANHTAAGHSVTGFDPAAAKEELAKSKYGAAEYPVEVLTWGGGWWKRFAEIFVAQVNQVLGTKFSVSVTDSNAAFARQQKGDFTAGVWGWLGMIDPDEYMGDIVHSAGWRNYGKFKNAEVDGLLEKARAELDPATRARLYNQAEALAIEEVPIIPCFCSNIHNLLRKNIKGFVQKPYSNFGDQFAHMSIV